MVNIESQNKLDQVPFTKEIENKGKDILKGDESGEKGKKLGDKIKKGIDNVKEKRQSSDFLKNFKFKDKVKNPTLKHMLDNPKDEQAIKDAQQLLRDKGSYAADHKLKDVPDGKVGPNTIQAIITHEEITEDPHAESDLYQQKIKEKDNAWLDQQLADRGYPSGDKIV